MMRALFAAVVWLILAATGHADQLPAWTQYSAAGLEARALATGPDCPNAQVDGASVPMRMRASASVDFPHMVCSLPISGKVRTFSVDGRALPVPKGSANKIAVVGDTGCRMKLILMQACNEPQNWPFALISARIAQVKPDLVIHVGDYLYRETPCLPLRTGCSGSPYGDNWEAWRADFFEPARAMLEAAPLALVRGNHESCSRAGRGWMRFFSPESYQETCRPHEEPFAIVLGKADRSIANGLTLWMLDVVEARDDGADPAQDAIYRPQFEQVAAIEGPVWIAMHKPVGIVGLNRTLLRALQGLSLPNLQAFISGHAHVFDVESFADGRPMQIVSGNGGDLLEREQPAHIEAMESALGMKMQTHRLTSGVWGYVLLEHSEKGTWTLKALNVTGTPLADCRLQGRAMTCS